MECKRVYDPVGTFYVDNNGNVHVKAVLLLPLEFSDGRYKKIIVNKSHPINVSSDEHCGILIVIECVGKPYSLREEAVSDYVELEFTVKEEELPKFPKGRFLRLIVLHNNEYLANPDYDTDLVPCVKTYMKQVGYDPESSFDNRPDIPCVVPYGPKTSGESILPDS